jgi:predicted dehydrogenase
MRKMRLFQPEAYVSIDFLEKQAEVIQLFDQEPMDEHGGMALELGGRTKWIRMHQPATVESNAILEELKSFRQAIADGGPPDVTLQDALSAMEMAQKVLNAIEESAKKAQIV